MTLLTSKIVKKLDKCLKFSISKDETRRNIMGVNHNSELRARVSCNGHVLTAIFMNYSDELKDLTIDISNGTLIDREFPRVSKVFHPDSYEKMKMRTFTITKDMIKKNASPESGTLRFYKSGPSFDIIDGETPLFGLQSKFLEPLADGSTYEVYYKNEYSPVIFRIVTGYLHYMVIMPFKL